jgi:hypothetical protein
MGAQGIDVTPTKRDRSTGGRLLALGVALAVAGCGSDSATDTAAEPIENSAAKCVPAPGTVATIEDGFNISGASLVDPYAVELPEENDLGVTYLVAAEIDDSDALSGEGDIGTWGVGDLEGGGPIVAIDGFAQEFTDWGSAAQEGSPADVARDALQVSDEASAARRCVEAA